MTVICDLDGTVTRGDTFLPFLRCCLREFGVRRASLVLVPVYALLYLVGAISNSRFKEILLTVVLADITLRQLEPLVEQFAGDVMARRLNPAMIRMLTQHRDRTDHVILASASFDLYVRRLAERLGIDAVVCTTAELAQGRITGRIAGHNCHGVEKLKRIEDLCGAQLDWRTTICYTDHYSDLPLLRKAGQGILVNPGVRTRLRLRGFVFERLESDAERSRSTASAVANIPGAPPA